MDNLISIIIPTYRRPKKLLRAVYSVLNQTYENFEILVINDDSDQESLKKILDGVDDKRINLFANKRGKGANGARNTGSLLAKGTFIAYLDDDDEWLPNYLELQYKYLNETGKETGLVYGDYLIETNGKWKSKRQTIDGDILSDLITDNFRIGSSSNIFIKKCVIKKVGLWDEDLMRQQDLEFLVRVFNDYKAISNNNIILKVYGHNDPPPEKIFKTREIFFDKLEPYLVKLTAHQKNLFFSNHYRRQANYLIKMKSFKIAKKYWLKAYRNKKIAIRKDVKLIVSLLKNIYD